MEDIILDFDKPSGAEGVRRVPSLGAVPTLLSALARVQQKTCEADICKLLRNWPRGHVLVLQQHEGNGISIGIAQPYWTRLSENVGQLDLFDLPGNPAADHTLSRFFCGLTSAVLNLKGAEAGRQGRCPQG
ncbi:hypothetical protein PG994_008180 [Apiospora phragmitis]|uniref:Uncharacterized protein n=1 Tax=Apiospora phragmitis TaxID=2905665 RepID=A0ABR1USB3_9PEZI